MPPACRKIFTEETEEELLSMTRDEASQALNDKERRFCEYYIGNLNIKMAAIRAGYGKKSAHIIGWKIRQRHDVNRYIAWLKLRVSKKCHITALDILDQYIKIAFADITDFVTIEKGRIIPKNSDEIDGQLVSKITRGPQGMTIELANKMRALEKLELYFDVMPKDWRIKIEERKLELMEQKLEIERIKVGLIEPEELEDDGFLEALRGSVEEVWDVE